MMGVVVTAKCSGLPLLPSGRRNAELDANAGDGGTGGGSSSLGDDMAEAGAQSRTSMDAT